MTSTEAERDEKQQALDVLQGSKDTLENELKATREALEGHKGESVLGETKLLEVKEEV